MAKCVIVTGCCIIFSLFCSCLRTTTYKIQRKIKGWLAHILEKGPGHKVLIANTTWAWITEGKNQTLVGAIPFCGEYPGPRFEDKFRSANQIDGISIADGGKMADS